MDRFKFRVWDNDNEFYSYIDFCDLSKTISELISFQEYFDDEYCKRNTDCVEFCTGLKDKNDNLIYEGDIVSDGYHKGVVKYGEFNCSCCDGVYGWYFDGGDIREAEFYEIVGNIHEQKDNK